MKRFAVGLTGGIASGKSLADAYLSAYFDIVDADLLVHRIYAEDKALIRAIENAFGPDCIRDAVVYRPALKNKVFADPEKLRLLNQIVHPVVGKLLREAIEHARKNEVYTLIVIPLLFENNWDQKLDHVLLVGCHPDIQLNRLIQRDGCSAERAMEIIHNQMDEAVRRKRCNSLITNDTGIELFQEKLEQWARQFFQEEQAVDGGKHSC